MEQILYEMDYSGMEMSPFQVDSMPSPLLDDDGLLALRKVQGDVYNLEDPGQDDHLFPDLLPLGQDQSLADQLSMDWMENVDLSQLVEKTVASDTEHLEEALPLIVQPEDIDLLQSLLQDNTAQPPTPPASPIAQVPTLIDVGDIEFNPDLEWEVINSPHDIDEVLSPDDIDRVLTPESLSPVTSNPTSPASVELSTIDISLLHSDQNVSATPTAQKTSRRKPYERTASSKRALKLSQSDDSVELDFSFRATEKLSKRERKKLQNKNAATKYRQKKKQESMMVLSEEQELEQRNKELRDKVDQLEREISCMKDVLGDIYKGLEAKSKK